MEKENRRLLITRFSALGDVLMMVPVIDALARQYPKTEITVVSRPMFKSIFELLPDNVKFLGKDARRYKGLAGISKLNNELLKTKPDAVCDLHFVNRTIFQNILFRIKGIKVFHIEKKPLDKFLFVRQRPLKPIKPSVIRYAEALSRAGFPVEIDPSKRISLVEAPAEKKGIAIAPFAAHKGKVYPLDLMEELVKELSTHFPVYLFGAGQHEKEILDMWETKYPGVTNMLGIKKDLAEELRFLSGMELMISMDSGNAHLASLAGTRVITLWGATHPMAGFKAWGQDDADNVQSDLPCRPCSIYGKKPCSKGDYPCFRAISVESILKKVLG